jgi:peptide-methionine (R)-S-oxide reductase
MTRLTFFALTVLATLSGCNAQQPSPAGDHVSTDSLRASSWCGVLSPDAYRVLREQGTEPRFSGEFWLHDEDGVYVCMGCGAHLFDSGTKFKSNSGWPSFYAPAGPEGVGQHVDLSHGMRRMEVVCNACGGHLGHVFEDGPPPTGLRYCINSVALDFVPRDSVALIAPASPPAE